MIPIARSTWAAAAALTVLAAAGLPVATPLAAQDAAAYERGTVGAGLELRHLDGVKRVLLIGAHPDDEDTALLAALARGLGVETAYLALTRGDGGQNLIGPELEEGLGALRTGELLAARRLDGGRQYFTRAFDFGYSKTAEESLRFWPREELLRDVTWVVRTFRPQVIVSIFTGTPADGHGQHQAAGIMAQEVFRAAGDPNRFPELTRRGARPWQPSKLYRLARRDPPGAAIDVATGTYDPLLERSYFQLAMASRSQHRSQDMGVAQPLGPRSSSLVLWATAADIDSARVGDAIFTGVDTALADLARPLPAEARSGALESVTAYRDAIHEAGDDLDALHPEQAAPPLARAVVALAALGDAGAAAGDAGEALTREVTARRPRLEDAFADAASLVTDVRVEDDLVVPGEAVDVSVTLWNGGPFPVSGARPTLQAPAGWRIEPVAPGAAGNGGRGGFFGRGGVETADPGTPADVAPGEATQWRFRVEVPPDASVSQLYWLRAPRDGEMYRWPDDSSLWGLPRDPAPLRGGVRASVLTAAGAVPVPVELDRTAVYVGVDKASGEFRRPVLVVPAVSVEAEPAVLLWPRSSRGARKVSVSLEGYANAGSSGSVRLEVPDGWRVTPASVPFAFDGPGQEQSVTFTVEADASVGAGRYPLRAVARTSDGRTFDRTVDLLDYPHIDRMALFRPAEVAATVVPVAVAQGLHVGYIMGSGDEVFDAIRQLGVDAELLGPDQVLGGDLSRFDVLVLGVRAYETRSDLQAANQRILDFARQGGTVLVQYNKYEYPQGGFAPYPVEISRPHDRVTDETSPVTFLQPDSPVLTTPNRIGPEDFEGWVTERGLYFLGQWDEHFVPILEMSDPGEGPKRGSLLVAPLGDGLYVYTGLSFFRELPAGVPGAYRLFANLLSLRRNDWNAWRAQEGAVGGR